MTTFACPAPPAAASVAESPVWCGNTSVIVALAEVYTYSLTCAREASQTLLVPMLTALMPSFTSHHNYALLGVLSMAVEVFAGGAVARASAGAAVGAPPGFADDAVASAVQVGDRWLLERKNYGAPLCQNLLEKMRLHFVRT